MFISNRRVLHLNDFNNGKIDVYRCSPVLKNWAMAKYYINVRSPVLNKLGSDKLQCLLVFAGFYQKANAKTRCLLVFACVYQEGQWQNTMYIGVRRCLSRKTMANTMFISYKRSSL